MINNSRYVIIENPKDRQPRYQTLEQDIRLIMAEIVRLSRLPYSSKKNMTKITNLDQHVQYLESLLASYEKDQKGFE